jgi:hypothetical protein
MALDPDSVRVDLLRIKRKLYLSFPEGSKERTDFMVASKLSELGYLTKLADPETVAIVYAEYDRTKKFELLNIGFWFGIGLLFSVMLHAYHQLHPQSVWLSFYYFPVIWGVFASGVHISHIVESWRKFQPFKKEFEVLTRRIDKLTQELKDLTK